MEIKRDGDMVLIQIPINSIVMAFDRNPASEDVNDKGNVENYKVTDRQIFMSEFLIELQSECPHTGLNRVHRMLDNAFYEMLEQGASGISDERLEYEK